MVKKKRLEIAGMLSYSTACHVLFDRMDYGDSLLLLYHNSKHQKDILRKFMSPTEDALIHYISHKKNSLDSSENCTAHTFQKVNKETLKEIKSHLDAHFSELEEQSMGGVILADWGQGKVGECSLFLPFIEELVQRCRKRVILVNAFDASEVDAEFISKSINLHKRTFLFQEGHSTVRLPELSHSWKKPSPRIHVLPQPLLESVLKGNLEFIILLFLERKGKSGYRLLKDISRRFHCTIPQARLYNLLYRLEKERKVFKRKGKGREVIYSLTPKTRVELQARKGHNLNAMSHFTGLIASSGTLGNEEREKDNQTSLSLFGSGSDALNLHSKEVD